MKNFKFLLIASALLLAFGCNKVEAPSETDPNEQTNPNEQTDPDDTKNQIEEFTVNGVTFKMVKVKGDTFTMGATPEQGTDAWIDEEPAHQVTLSDFYIGQTEVTQELWKTVTGIDADKITEKTKLLPISVTRDDVVNIFLPKLNALTGMNFTLPTEAQWEYAARGGNKSKNFKYSGSNNIDDVAWYSDNSNYEFHPVAQKLPNELDIYDMSGNVNEYCSDSYLNYSAEAKTDPVGYMSESDYVIRGGDWGKLSQDCRVSSRSYFTVLRKDCGFRLALSGILALNNESMELGEGKSKTLFVGYNGVVPVETEITWTSSEPSVATVDSKGKVTAISSGSTVITAKVSSTGQEMSCIVEVVRDAIVVNGIPFKMVKVKGGTFTMGATPEQGDDAYENEKPAHQVTLSDFYIGQTEVSQELWKAVLGDNPSWSQAGPKKPVVFVNWDMIVNRFLPKLNELTGMNFTLPTEAQWEFAARGGNKSQGYKYSGSNTIEDVAWHNENSPSGIQPSAQKLPNELGIYDMSGNVWEWCSDWYGPYSAEAQTDPTGPKEGTERVLRGGGCDYGGGSTRISHRISFAPCSGSYVYGFRLALSL